MLVRGGVTFTLDLLLDVGKVSVEDGRIVLPIDMVGQRVTESYTKAEMVDESAREEFQVTSV